MTDQPDRLSKRLTAARLAGVPELEAAFSDISGLSDISDGEGVGEPSAGPHVKLLQESLLAMGYALPREGANGIYGSETQAAVLQLQIDAGHPWPAGQEWEHIGGIAGSNSMVHFDMFDPGGTVGNVTRTPTGIAATAVRLSESDDNPYAGFDETTSPPSLVLGTTTRRRVRADREPAGSDVTFAAADPTVATVGETFEGFVVGGERAGTTTVRAAAGGETLAELVVYVKDAREEVVNFFFASDSSEPPFATAREHDKATILTLRLNRLWRRQANVHFTLGHVSDIIVPAAIGPVVRAADAVQFAPFAVAGELNVFCVWDRERDGFDPAAGMVFLPDADSPDGMDLVHAAGHFLGFREPHTPSGLMSAGDGSHDRRRISTALAHVANPDGGSA